MTRVGIRFCEPEDHGDQSLGSAKAQAGESSPVDPRPARSHSRPAALHATSAAFTRPARWHVPS